MKKDIPLTPVKGSSTIKAIGHDPENNVLHVAFHSGGTYTYPDVSAGSHVKLRDAKSVGSHFHRHIKSKHTGTKIT